jgi:hypothetical protein
VSRICKDLHHSTEEYETDKPGRKGKDIWISPTVKEQV